MNYLGYILFAMLVLRFLVVLVNRLSSPFLKSKQPETSPFVSVLIPARNEEKNLPLLLDDLKACTYPNIEILVFNDQSADGTQQVLDVYSAQMSNLLYMNKISELDGWSGKSYACHSIAQKAKGAFFLFIDADVRLNPDALSKAIAYCLQHKVSLLSVFPQQKLESTGEWETVPVMNWILLSMLPLPLVRFPWFSSLSAANGQFMLFEADNYRHNQWHLQVKNQVVEDIAIARLMKKKKYVLSVKLGNNDIFCRMYSGYQEAISGFSRNIHQYFQGNRFWMVAFLLIILIRIPFFLISGQFLLLSLSVFMVLSMKIMVSYLSRQDILRNLYEHGAQLLAILAMVKTNLKNGRKGSVEWKGRILKS